MIKPIVLYGNRILRTPARNYAQGADIKDVVQDLWDTMYNAEGAGLAGPQINLSNRIFVIDLPDQKWKQVFINPTIEKKYGNMEASIEGCLSLPGLSAPIVREDEIEITYFDENWKFHVEKYNGIKARVIQHEYDHLEGTLWVDRVDPAVGMLMISQLNALQNRLVETTYPSM